MPDRFSGSPESRVVKCSNCKDKMEFGEDGDSTPSFVENDTFFPEVHICWDCLDSIDTIPEEDYYE